MTQSILPVEFRGVMTICGVRGVGKSFLAAQADAPQNMAYFDFESKGEGIDAQLHFGLYRALTQEAKTGDPISLYDITMDAFAKMEQDRYTVVVLDNISPLELACTAEAMRNAAHYAREFGLNLKNILAGRFGGARSVVNFMISSRISNVLHGRGVKLIIAVSHTGSVWGAAGPIVNKLRSKGADRWQELSILSLILVHGDKPPTPAALVQKEQLGTLRWDEKNQEHIVNRRLPMRIPFCTFAEIRRYLREPADVAHPAPGEVPSPDETDPFSDTLSREQISLMRLSLEQQQREERGDDAMLSLMTQPVPKPVEVPELDNEARSQLVTLVDSGAKPAEVAKVLGVTVPQAVKLMKAVKEE